METAALDEVPEPVAPPRPVTGNTVFAVLYAISFSHLLNDTVQAVIPSLYPYLRQTQGLSLGDIGWITFAFQCTASMLQPVVGLVTDRRPIPNLLALGMTITLVGLLMLSQAHGLTWLILSAALVGMGSSVFHPEASRVAHMAAGKNRGLAQSLFQVGGNAGTSIGPLLVAAIVVPRSQGYVAWFSVVAALGMVVLWNVGKWQWKNLHLVHRKKSAGPSANVLPRKTVTLALAVLVVLTFSKYVYLASLTNYYTFYLIDRFHLSVQSSQIYLFIFLAAVAAGTILGGPIGDRIGRKRVIWVSILGVAPFSLAMPFMNLAMTAVLSVFIGLILASAFSAILVYAQELLPGNVGMIAGLFFGLAFGIAGISSAVLGHVADHTGIIAVFHGCAYLPLLGLLTIFLPDLETAHQANAHAMK